VGRAGLRELLKNAAYNPKPFDYVLIDDTSRLSRDKIDQAEIVRDLRDLGIFVYFVSDGIDTKDEIAEDIILPVHGIKDSLFARDLAKRTKRGMAGQVLKGFNPGGRTYGYQYKPILDPSGAMDKKTRQIKSLGTAINIDAEQAPIVKLIFSMYASGYGLKMIAARLNQQSIDPPGKDRQRKKGSESPSWCPNAIRSMLQNPKYIGDWTWNKCKWTRIRKTGRRKYTQRQKDEWIEYINPELAIVENDIWAAVQSRFGKNKETYCKGERQPRKDYLLSGLLKCGVCGANLIVVKCKGGDHIGYRCSFNWHRGSSVCPNNVTIRKSDVENNTILALQNRILNPDVIRLIIEQANIVVKERLQTGMSEKKRLFKKRGEISGEIQNLVDFISKSRKTSLSIQSALEIKEAQLKQITDEIASIENRNFGREIKVDQNYIVKWLSDLKCRIPRDVTVARIEISNIIGKLFAVPFEINGNKGLRFTGKPKIDGILGIFPGVSTRYNSGGRI
jgi:DNA invertase Pin-like site-specific DNA recombinase